MDGCSCLLRVLNLNAGFLSTLNGGASKLGAPNSSLRPLLSFYLWFLKLRPLLILSKISGCQLLSTRGPQLTSIMKNLSSSPWLSVSPVRSSMCWLSPDAHPDPGRPSGCKIAQIKRTATSQLARAMMMKYQISDDILKHEHLKPHLDKWIFSIFTYLDLYFCQIYIYSIELQLFLKRAEKYKANR